MDAAARSILSRSDQGRQRLRPFEDYWSTMQEEVQVTAIAGDVALPNIVVDTLPNGVTVTKAILIFSFWTVENTNAAANALAGAQEIQIRSDAPTAWVDAINFVDNAFTLPATTVRGGTAIIGSINVAATVDENDTYNVQWDEAVADLNNIQFNVAQVGLRIWYSV